MAFSPETYALLKGQSGGGGGNYAQIFTFSDVDGTLDKTWNEINTAIRNNYLCIMVYNDENNAFRYLCESVVNADDEVYSVMVASGTELFLYETNSPDGYPEFV